jgi:hypothetical protein
MRQTKKQTAEMSFSHYDWLDAHWWEVVKACGGDPESRHAFTSGLIGAHGDKFWTSRSDWEKAEIPFHHGVALALMTYTPLFRDEVGETAGGWVTRKDWVTQNYHRFQDRLREIPDRI